MNTSYKTPPLRLARFFHQSRDGWKRRCAAKQQLIRKLRVQVRDLAESRDHWKRRAAQLRSQVAKAKESPLEG